MKKKTFNHRMLEMMRALMVELNEGGIEEIQETDNVKRDKTYNSQYAVEFITKNRIHDIYEERRSLGADSKRLKGRIVDDAVALYYKKWKEGKKDEENK